MAQMLSVGHLIESALDLCMSFSLVFSKGLSVFIWRCHCDKVIYSPLSDKFAQVNNQPGQELKGGHLKSSQLTGDLLRTFWHGSINVVNKHSSSHVSKSL